MIDSFLNVLSTQRAIGKQENSLENLSTKTIFVGNEDYLC